MEKISPRPLLIAAALLLAGGSIVANAYIGQTAEALRGPDGKYGVPIAESSPRLEGSHDRVDVFVRKGINVTVEYDEKGKAWRMTYQKKNLGDEAIDELLKRNAPGGVDWSKPVTYRGNQHWITNDRELHAVFYGAPLFKLVVMTDEAAKATRVKQGLVGPATKSIDKEEGEENTDGKTESKPDDPLDGF